MERGFFIHWFTRVDVETVVGVLSGPVSVVAFGTGVAVFEGVGVGVGVPLVVTF